MIAYIRPYLAIFTIGMMASGIATQSSAFVGLSRACRWADIPFPLQVAITQNFGASFEGVALLDLPASVQPTIYALESITANWGYTQGLFLIAQSAQYARSRSTNYVFLETSYVSEWNGRGIWANNRGWLSSARAGSGSSSDISKIWVSKSLNYEYSVVGSHSAWDDQIKHLYGYPLTTAMNCNCAELGFELDWTLVRAVPQMICP